MSRPPQLDEAIFDLTEPVQFEVIAKSVDDFEAKETVKNKIIFQANLQPLPSRKLIIKPEGQRSWKWWTMYSKSNINLDWILQDQNGRLFRVMNNADWNRSGYYEYELTETVVPAT